MAFAHISSVADGIASDGGPSSPAIDTSGADLLVVVVFFYNAVTADVTLTDSKSNSWTGLTRSSHASGMSCRIYYSQGGTVGTNHTLSLAGAQIFVGVWFGAFSGSHATPFDLENGATGSGSTSQTTGSITPSEGNCLVIAGICTDPGSSHSVNGGFTGAFVDYSGGNYEGGGGAYLIQTSAAAANPTFSWTTNATRAARIASFKSAEGGGGGGGGNPWYAYAQQRHRQPNATTSGLLVPDRRIVRPDWAAQKRGAV